ncbi:MAG: hypothetical protein IJ225_10360 [Solobacterium sp.]|nr:hypothetical protein [Solobacterium sp.]
MYYYGRKRAQLNAISRSYTQKAQKEAREYLESVGINYEDYCKETGWKGGITRLASKIRSNGEKR